MWQLEDEATKRFEMIVEEDGIFLKSSGLDTPVDDIGTWIASHCITLWGKAFKDFFPKAGTFTKKQPFLAQAGAEDAMKRAILRYFWRELVVKGAIERKNIPARFNKWIDISSSECIFTDYQKKHFGRPHLLQCPWYLEMKETDKCPGEERSLRSSNDIQMKQQEVENAIQMEEDTSDPRDEEVLSDKQRKKQAEKKARIEAEFKEKEDKKKERAEELMKKKEQAVRNKELAKLVTKHGPEKLLSHIGISPSGSSMPSTVVPFLSYVPLPSQTVYTIPTTQVEDVHGGVEVINDNIRGILELFSSITGADEPQIWLKIKEWIKAHQGNKVRRKMGEEHDSVVDLVVFDVPEDLPVPGFGISGETPLWNVHPKRPVGGVEGKFESDWIQYYMDFASNFLQDNGAVIVFYPDSRFISNELLSWADWAGFQEERRWFAINGLPLAIPDKPSSTHKCFWVKCFVWKEDRRNGRAPSRFVFNDRPEQAAKGITLSTDGHVTNFISVDSLTLDSVSHKPFRGAREKSVNFLEALVDLCTVENDIVMDLTASTGILYIL